MSRSVSAGDISIAMGAAGSEVAIHSATIALMNNDLRRLPFLIRLSRLTRSVINQIGYDNALYGFDGHTCGVIVSIDEQSSDIAQGVDKSEEVRAGGVAEDYLDIQGAGDQGMMFGYACDETPDLMPMPIWLAHRLSERLSEVRKSGAVPYLRPDGKTQVTIDYVDGKPARLSHVLISTQHQDGIDRDTVIRPDLIEQVIRPIVPAQFQSDGYDVHVNPTGKFVIGGPHGDAGLTGRKIIVDTYGGAAPHGGGAFSGKDPTKVDRSAAYAARYLAKNVVAAGLAKRCTVQLSYAIGVAQPLSIYVDTHGTGKVPEAKLEKALAKVMDLSPRGIRTHLNLNRPIYARTAAYGHFGRAAEKDGGFSWEKTDLATALKAAVK